MSLLAQHGLLLTPLAPAIPPPAWVDRNAAAVASKLISWWDFDANANDLFGNNNLTGTATYSAGLIGNKATKSSLLVKSSAVVPPGMTTAEGVGGLSFGGWVYVAGTGGEDIEVRQSSSAEGYRIAVRNGNQAFFIVGATGSTSISSAVGALAVGNFYFLTATYNPVTRAMQLYINGALAASGTAAANFTPTYLSVGRVIGGVYTALQNDSTFLCNATLTASDIAWLFSAGAGIGGSALVSAPRGVWTWFNDPRALLLPDGRLVESVVESDGVIALDWTDDAGVSHSRTALSTAGTPDDHDGPALLRRSDGILVAFGCRHNASTYYMWESAAADDPTTMTSTDITSQIGAGTYAYANPFQLSGEAGSPIYNFFRKGTTPTWSIYFSKWTAASGVWTTAQRLLDGDASSGRPYLKACQNGSNRIDFACTDGHPNAVATNGIRHFYYQAGGWYNSDGTSMGAPPFDTVADLSTVYDGSTYRAWIHDIKIGSDGHPRVVFAVFVSTTDHRYYYGRWTGSAWVTSEICAAGGYLYSAEPYYSGGVCLDSDDPNIVYASRGQGGGRWALFKYQTANGGASFAETDLGVDGIRPFHVKGAGLVIAVNGRYVTYSSFQTKLALIDVG